MSRFLLIYYIIIVIDILFNINNDKTLNIIT